MDKNTIIEKIVDKLLDQRGELVRELRDLNHNEGSCLEKQNALELQISNIDMQISSHIAMCDLK
jgi:regulator of replication initiation timing